MSTRGTGGYHGHNHTGGGRRRRTRSCQTTSRPRSEQICTKPASQTCVARTVFLRGARRGRTGVPCGSPSDARGLDGYNQIAMPSAKHLHVIAQLRRGAFAFVLLATPPPRFASRRSLCRRTVCGVLQLRVAQEHHECGVRAASTSLFRHTGPNFDFNLSTRRAQ